MTSVMLSANNWYVMLLLPVLKLMARKACPTVGSLMGGEFCAPATAKNKIELTGV